MKKIFFYLGIAAMALGLASCEPKEKIDWDKVTVNGFYVAGPATGSDEIKPDCVMAVGFNEVDKAVRDGMYEKYIVLEADKEFYLLYNDGNTKSRYSATLAQFNTPEEEAYADNPPSVMKGKLVIGDDAPAMKVAKTGLYHIVLDINKTGDLDAAGGAQILLLDASDFGVRGGMNGWGFTSADPKVTEFSNEGVTFNFKDQELGKGGEFKFATGNYWKVTLDDAGKVKAEVSLAAGMTLNGDNIKVDKGGLYDIALTFKLAQGSFDKSFSYTAVCTQESTAPETMYMNGGQWGGTNWDWSADGIVELVPVWGAPGYFWCTRWFDGSQEFKFCAKKEWNGDFGDNGNNCKVPESGFYTVLVNGNENSVEIKPAEVYVIGLCGTPKTENQDVWDFNGADVLKLAADGQVLKGTLASSAELRIASKVHPAAPIDGVTTGNGWIDWWKTEFIFFDGKIAYRGAGNDQERVQGVAGKVLVLDFNNGTAALEDGAPAGDATSTFLAWLANPAADLTLSGDVDLTGKEVPAVEELTATLDGAGHAIKGLVSGKPLFNTLSGAVKNLVIDASCSFVPTVASFGIIAGNNKGTISNVTNKAEIKYAADEIKEATLIAAIAGQSTGEISGCVNEGAVSVSSNGALNGVALAGIAGYQAALMKSCVNRGAITMTAKYVDAKVTIVDVANALPSAAGLVAFGAKGFAMEDCENHGKLTVKYTSIDTYLENSTANLNRNQFGGVVASPCGDITRCKNFGEVEISAKHSTPGTAIKNSDNKKREFILCVGGIGGGDYTFTNTSDNYSNSSYYDCVNEGNIVVDSDAAQANSAIGGIVGWPSQEKNPITTTAKGCVNKGNITGKGAMKCRIGGVEGGTGVLENCTNEGIVTLETSNEECVIGSVCGFRSQNHAITGCTAKGEVHAKVKAAGVGGLIGNMGNVASVTGTGCVVDCKITTVDPDAAKTTGLIVGYFNGKTKEIILGSESDPIKVKGSVNGAAASASNVIGTENDELHYIYYTLSN